MSNPKSAPFFNTVGVRFQTSAKVQYFDGSGIELEVGDRVLVETPQGIKEGVIAIAPGQVIFSELRGPMDAVVQKAEA
ncbi:MAG: hypothetical protein BZY79_01255 [SAR202 cluster bacterium Casp-Chloro-G4]|nr:hypothetical protein [Chloroflexota bacterium]PKB61926.1 MAG: hypothetical protein BZY79_01255 [SAR202 cluster bacterium Casp-Chloro-G4]